MKKRTGYLPLMSIVCFAAVLASFVFNAATVDALGKIVRLGGSGRIETAIRISEEGWKESGAKNVVIASGLSFPDAMAGVPLAASLDAPILLTEGRQPEENILAQLKSLSAENVYILGGEVCISKDFAGALSAAGYNIERIAGASRSETAAAIAQKLIELGARPDKVFIASGRNFPDALSVSPAAGVLGCPILYADEQGGLSEGQIAVIKDNSITGAVILGGEAAVPNGVKGVLNAAGITDIERLAGADRYQTSLAINRCYSSVLSGSDIAVASGENFPDALSGGAFAAKKAIPVVLLSSVSNIEGAYSYVSERNAQTAYVFGLEGALSAYAVDTFFAGGTITTTTTTTTTTTKATTTTTTAATTASSSAKRLTVSGTVNVRSGAGLEHEKIGTIKPGEQHVITGSAKDSGGTVWYTISYNGRTGYVSSTVVKVNDGSQPTGSSGKKAYLTFDDGPSKNTVKILDILDRYNVKATFFVIYRSGYESVYKDIVNRGHTIALHSYTHNYSTIYRSTTAYFNDLNKLSNYVENLTGVRSNIMRFPGGGSNTVSRSYCRGIMSTLTKEVQNRGYRYYDWNVDSCDASANRVSASTILSNIKKNCGSQKSAIILMHDSPAKTTTVTALPDIIKYLQSKGYDILPITEDTPQLHHAVNN